MKKLLLALVSFGIIAVAPLQAIAGPKDDVKMIRTYFAKKFPGVKLSALADGIYALDADRRGAWEQIMDFPPYEPIIDTGEELFNKPFKKTGKTYASCFKNGGVGIAQNYPYWDKKTKQVKTIEQELIQCAKKNGAKLKPKAGKIAALSSYMHNTSRGKKTNVVIPKGDAGALAAYESGKQIFFARRGQLNFSCAHCHVAAAGQHIGGNILSPALGHTTGFPVFRLKWDIKSAGKKSMGTMHRRYGGCNKQVRAKPLKAQSTTYRNLQYFHTYMSNGMKLNGPSVRG